ncbi:hypothetical protein [Neobacillus vireti]|uniref:Uncharacterized protein n=1 Tax=Neobacillus vireti LMG 21834 TaxID=1131730 RepID=A0AB94IK88_9BACI|nr:hypothetical protein [Neobacillus vireti]ETI67476.1 hypothetical protein BAVI_17452 [Neobacillus vireti LMG 21834]KLT15524.1 hypothetical protein AA980_23020 [Neobacillus vireti]
MDENQHSIIFIGKKKRNNELQLTSKPDFSDAICLSKPLTHSTKNTPYQSIAIDGSKNLSIHFSDENIHFTYYNKSLQVLAGDKNLSDEKVLDICSNFAFKEGNKVTFLKVIPKRNTIPRKKKEVRVLLAGKELEGE